MKQTYLLLFVLIAASLQAKTYRTYQKGKWSSRFTWQNQEAPGFHPSDTIRVSHYTELDSTLFLESGAYVQVDSSGVLCGHNSITVKAQALLYKYGFLQIDSLFLISGRAIMDWPEEAIFYRQVSITGQGASFIQKGAKSTVGPWFECKKRPSEVGLADTRYSSSMLYPNPNAGSFLFTPAFANNTCIFTVYNSSGQQVYKAKSIAGQALEIQLAAEARGIYYWVYSDGVLKEQGTFMVIY